MVCWGANHYGQAKPPLSVDGTTGTARAITAGDGHSCAVQAETGAVVCWGDDYNEQTDPPDALDGRNGPASILAAGGTFTLAIPEPAATALAAAALLTLALMKSRGRFSRFHEAAESRSRCLVKFREPSPLIS